MSAAHAQSTLGWLEVKPAGARNLVQITGHAMAAEPVSGLEFALSMRRKNGGNSSRTQQSGRFDLAPSQPKVLSATSVNVEPGDELTIELKILDHGKEVSSATLTAKGGAGAGQTL